jgi:hypothetical protein
MGVQKALRCHLKNAGGENEKKKSRYLLFCSLCNSLSPASSQHVALATGWREVNPSDIPD